MRNCPLTFQIYDLKGLRVFPSVDCCVLFTCKKTCCFQLNQAARQDSLKIQKKKKRHWRLNTNIRTKSGGNEKSTIYKKKDKAFS